VPAGVTLRATVLTSALSSPWGLAFLPDGRMLVTQKAGTMVLVSANGSVVSAPFGPGLPNLVSSGQGGLMDVVLDPDFNLASNPRIYWTYSESGSGGAGTAVARGDLVGNAIQNAAVIYRQVPKVGGDGHFGSRLAFRSDKTLFVTLGERQRDDPANPGTGNAQNLATTLGKVIRIHRDGSIPTGNPVFGVAGALPEIWSYGHRNPQGATLGPDGRLWMHEHGPQGGDEINRPQPGRNYGWPVITFGEQYGGGPIGAGITAKAGMEPPLHHWTPSIAPSGMAFLTSDRYGPAWRGSLFVGSLKFQFLNRVELAGGQVVGEERLLTDLGERIRDVRQGPDGWLYVLTDNAKGRLLRLAPP
jgi:glucose/arabinose dehydrogenase